MQNEISLILFLQSQEWALPFMKFASLLGAAEFYLLFMSVLYWCFNPRLGFRAALILVLSQGLNSALKIAFHSPRPYWINNEILPLESSSSFGMPSGHAQNSVCFWGIIASSIRSPRAWFMAIALSLFIGVSRIYLGVHFAEDVVAGWIIGALLLSAFLISEDFLAERISRLDLRLQVLVSFLASLGLLALYGLGWAIMGNWQMPEAWNVQALTATGEQINPLNPSEAFEVAGILFGISAGYAWLIKLGSFLAEGPAVFRIKRFLLGITILAIIWFGIGAFRLEPPAEYAVFYVRSIIAGAWLAAGAPILFKKLGLAENEKMPD